MSKGSTGRPFSVPREQYEANRARIFPEPKRERWIPPALPRSAAMRNPPIPMRACAVCGVLTNETYSILGVCHLACFKGEGK